MDHVISIDESETWAMRNGRLEALKARYVPPLGNQQQLGDGDLNKIMDRDLYEATKEGDVDKLIGALEKVSESRKLALSLIFDQVAPSGDSLLHVAARYEKDDVTKLILFHFPNTVTQKNPLEDTPLHVAVQNESLKATRMMIPQSRDLQIMYWKNIDRKSPLYLAAETGNMEILRLLVEASARDEDYAKKIQGRSPVLAALDGRGGSDILREIIDRLPKLLHLKGESGETPLHYAASVATIDEVRFLLGKCGYLALQMDENGSYPIHIASERGIVEMIDELLNVWPDLAEIKNRKGQNILHVAAKGGKRKVVRHILKETSNIEKLVNLQDVDGNTPLHLAAMHNRCRVLSTLTMNKRSYLKLLNNKGLTALDVAMESESLSTSYSPLLGRALLIAAGVPRSKGQDIWSPREQISGASKSSRAEWIKDQVNTRLVVATLVASVTFTAGFTLPGGYNASSDPHPGTATLLHHGVFQLFVISNMLAMYSSILAVVVLLWGHITDSYIAERAYHSAGPLLLTALTGMSVAFLAAVIVAVSKLSWLTSLVLCIAVLYLTMLILALAALIFPFSQTVMRVVSFYYLDLALPRPIVWKVVLMSLRVLSFPLVICYVVFGSICFSNKSAPNGDIRRAGEQA